MLPNQNPAHEGRFREAILKAERDVASSRLVTATAGLLPRPGTSAWWRVAFAPDPAAMPGMEGRERADTPRWSAERWAFRLHREGPMPRKRGVAPYPRDILRLYASRRSATPSVGGGRDEGEKKGEEPGRQMNRERRNWAV
jgi:hypothetical protein